MRSIGVLKAIGKKKRMGCDFLPPHGPFAAMAGIFAVSAVLCFALPESALGADTTISTRNNESVIERDPASGDRVMRTPDPKPQEDYQGPQTIIVAPEVYPGGYPGGHRPNRPDRPNRPQPR